MVYDLAFLSFPTFGYFIKYLTEYKKPSDIPSRTTCNHQTFFGNSNRYAFKSSGTPSNRICNISLWKIHKLRLSNWIWAAN